jgi:hypothetical protein
LKQDFPVLPSDCNGQLAVAASIVFQLRHDLKGLGRLAWHKGHLDAARGLGANMSCRCRIMRQAEATLIGNGWGEINRVLAYGGGLLSLGDGC